MGQDVTQMEIEGEIFDQTMPFLIQQISKTGETGILKVKESGFEKSVFFQEGRAIFATSTDPEDRLGELLLRKGSVSLENYLQASEESVRTRKRLGTVMVESGFIRDQELTEGVIEQVKEILLGIFQISTGKYHFAMGSLPSKEVITLKLGTGDLILEGMKRIRSRQRIWSAVGGLETIFQVTEQMEELTKEVTLSLEEWSLLSHLETGVSLGEIMKNSPLNDVEICRLIWAFRILGIVKKASTERGVETTETADQKLPGSGRVLVVDDEEVILDFFKSVLESEGFQVTTASCAKGAQEALRDREFDAVVLDVILPDMNGVLLFHQIRQENPTQAEKVVFLSGMDMVKEFNQNLANLGAGFLPKPVDYEVLINMVREVVNRDN